MAELRVVAVDWSGARQDDGSLKIRWYEVRDGAPSTLSDRIGRTGVIARLIDDAARDPRIVVGFDFAFSTPAWYLRERNLGSAPELWDWLGRDECVDTLLSLCAPPFWGRPGKPRPHDERAQLRRTDRAIPLAPDGSRTVSAKSVFQVGGAGAVGTGSLRGMALLPRLRAAGFAIWPFDPPSLPLAVEIYPRALTGAVRKRSPEARAAWLEPLRRRYGDAVINRVASCEDDFDAFVSALRMWDAREDLFTLPTIADPILRLEGLIWHPAWRTAITGQLP